ncbi:MAG: preprotein translocase subunit SecY [Archaeoglobaceae archaeon]
MINEAIRSLQPYVERIPSVARPTGHLSFKQKLSWTVAVLLLYFALSNVTVFGLSPESIDILAQYRAFLAGASGSILALGIGPIVTASIILQLMVGAGIVKLNLNDPNDRAAYQNFQRLLVIVMIVLTALPQILGGFLKPNLEIASVLGVSPGLISFIIFFQLFIGGMLIVYMDEVVTKWGIGSGVSLFIMASISQALISGLFNWVTVEGQQAPMNIPGIIPTWVWISQNVPMDQLLSAGGLEFLLIQGGFLALITTIIIILMVVFAEGTRVEIPLAHSMVRGARGRFPIKLIYASVLPMIFVRALQANITVMGMVLYQRGVTIFGEYAQIGGQLQPVNGLMYMLSPINGPQDWVPSLVRQSPYYADLPNWMIIGHVFTDAAVLIVGCVVFAIFWVQTAGMDAKSVANQLMGSGMQVPGFRKNRAVLQRVLQRYIPRLTILGGITLAILALAANMMGTIGQVGGTGLLLAVSIAYRFYQDLAKEQMTEMHPMLRRFLGEE